MTGAPPAGPQGPGQGTIQGRTRPALAAAGVLLLLLVVALLALWGRGGGSSPAPGSTAGPGTTSGTTSPASRSTGALPSSSASSPRPSAPATRWSTGSRSPSSSPTASNGGVVPPTVPGSQATPVSGLPVVPEASLPREALLTLDAIRAGGPFEYRQDDQPFGNREGLLPQRPRGYYREYTVETPGSPDRGARRIIAGEEGDLYWTSDHYRSFAQIVAGR